MERAEQMPKIIKQKETPTYPTLGESAKQVWYGVGKAVEWHMPHKWNERIIKKINTVLPKLSPEMQQAIIKHHKAIETGAKVAGITIYAAEVYTMYFLTSFARRIFSLRKLERFWKRQFSENSAYKQLRVAYREKYQWNEEQFMALAGAVMMMLQRVYSGKETRLPIPNTKRAGSPNALRKIINQMYEDAFASYVRHVDDLHGRKVRDPVALRHTAKNSRAQWEKLGKAGLGDVYKYYNIPDRRFKPMGITSFSLPPAEVVSSPAMQALRQAQSHDPSGKYMVTLPSEISSHPLPYPPSRKAGRLWLRHVMKKGMTYSRKAKR